MPTHLARSVALSLLPLVLASCATTISPSSSSEIASSPEAAIIDDIGRRGFALGLAPGMAVAVVRGDRPIYMKGFGFADVEAKRTVTPQTVFYIASTTKSFTGLAAALLANEGTIDLDAPLSRYLPTLKLEAPLSSNRITLRQLLTHTHGIDNDGPVVFRTAFSGEFTKEQLIDLLSRQVPAKTGTAYSYGNIGYNIASLAIDEAVHGSWKDVLQKRIFEPLGMWSTTAYLTRSDPARLALAYATDTAGFRKIPYAKSDDNMHAAGGLVTTAEDLTKWLEVHMNAGRLDGKQIFPASVIAEAQRKQVEQRETMREYSRYGYGLGWNEATFNGDTLIHHFGGYAGFSTHLSFMPQHKLGVVVLVNENSSGSALGDLVAQQIYTRLLGKPRADSSYADRLSMFAKQGGVLRQRLTQDRARRAARSQTLLHPPSTYVGTYVSPAYGRLTFEYADGKFRARMGRLASDVEVYDASKDALRVELVPGQGEVVRFTVNGERAENLEYKGVTFVRVE